MKRAKYKYFMYVTPTTFIHLFCVVYLCLYYLYELVYLFVLSRRFSYFSPCFQVVVYFVNVHVCNFFNYCAGSWCIHAADNFHCYLLDPLIRLLNNNSILWWFAFHAQAIFRALPDCDVLLKWSVANEWRVSMYVF